MADKTGSVAPADQEGLVELSAEIVSAYVSHNAMSSADLAKLIGDVYTALKNLSSVEEPEPVKELKPAVAVRRSVTPDYIICLEDGMKFKSLKRHLRTHFDMSPEQYRDKWGLPLDYPMVAPNYSATRSRLAKDNGLGRKPGAPAARRSRSSAT
jgi:predicted transcriptional regulator